MTPRFPEYPLRCQQQPQLLSQPQLLLSQPQPLRPLLLPPQQQHRMMISRMIHRQLLPPKPLFPQHMFVSPHLLPGPVSRDSVLFYGAPLSQVTEERGNFVRS